LNAVTRAVRETAYLRQGESGADPESIRTSDADDFQNLTGISLFKVTFVVHCGTKLQFHEDPVTFSRDLSQIVKKCPYLAMLKDPSKNCWMQISKWMTYKI